MIVLKKVRTEDEADKFVQVMGWQDNYHFRTDVGDSLVGYWIDTEEAVDAPPRRAKRVLEISPVGVVVHGRLFPGKVSGYRLGDKAYVREEDWEALF